MAEQSICWTIPHPGRIVTDSIAGDCIAPNCIAHNQSAHIMPIACIVRSMRITRIHCIVCITSIVRMIPTAATAPIVCECAREGGGAKTAMADAAPSNT